MIAALYVETNGCYFGLPDVDPWDIHRDARKYDGPHTVVAHPPCARWCQMAGLVESMGGRKIGEDDGCFAAALASVRKWGGVLEHPAFTLAWPRFQLMEPPSRGWARMMTGERVCEVAQSAYGHKCRKLTWLLYVGDAPPPILDWRQPEGTHITVTNRMRGDGSLWVSDKPAIKKSERSSTPIEFRDLLISIARNARQ